MAEGKFGKDLTKKYLHLLSEGQPLYMAAKNCGVNRDTVRKYCIRNPSFKKEIFEAQQRSIDVIEFSLWNDLQNGKADKTERMFYLCNKRKKYWSDIRNNKVIVKEKLSAENLSPELLKLELDKRGLNK